VDAVGTIARTGAAVGAVGAVCATT
jgi:hypothetical protein